MKFTIEKSVLQNAVLISARAVPSKSPISALEGLLIEAGTAITVKSNLYHRRCRC